MMAISRFTFAMRTTRFNQRCQHGAASVKNESVRSTHAILEEEISKWKKFLTKEAEAKLGIARGNNLAQRVFLSLNKICPEVGKGCLMEFSLGKVSNPSPSASSHFGLLKRGAHIKLFPSDEDVKPELEGVVQSIDTGKLEVRLKKSMVDVETIGAIKRWEIMLAKFDSTKQLLAMLNMDSLKKTPGYDTLKKILKIKDLDVHTRYRRRNIKFGLKLNESQINAVKTVVNSQQEFTAIHGPPGTGKTRVIAEIVYQLLCGKKRSKIVVCAPSNKAVDNVLIACLARGIDELRCTRLGFPTEESTSTHISSMIKQHAFYADLKKPYGSVYTDTQRKMWNVALEKYLKKSVMRKVDVVFCTVSYAGLYQFPDAFKPDLIIMDEAGQITEPHSWQILLKGKRFVVVGDHHQLGPILYSKEAKFGELKSHKSADESNNKDGDDDDVSKSLLERLKKDFKDTDKVLQHYVHFLDTNYRSNWLIQHWSNQQFYENKLKANEAVKYSRLDDLPAVKAVIDRKVNDSKHPNKRKPLITDQLVLVDTALTTSGDLKELNDCYSKYYNNCNIHFFDVKQEDTHSFYNTGEALCAAYQLLLLREGGLAPSDIGCITPYIAQTRQIKKFLGKRNDAIDVSSVDSFQGQQREAIVMSFVRNNHQNMIGFLENLSRMNVSITRAKRQFFLIASSNSLKSNKALGDLYKLIRRLGAVISPKELLINNNRDLQLLIGKKATRKTAERSI